MCSSHSFRYHLRRNRAFAEKCTNKWVRRTPGRPRARRPALAQESPEDGFYDVDRLLHLFLRQPGQPLQWRVIEEHSLNESSEETSNFIDEVVGLRLAEGVYKWSVRFGDGTLRNYEAEELARVVNRGHQPRFRVTN
ncbi:hypothetical protein P3T76_007338 [Phytophthora citrophthora]|uniref:Chromo domain-containing protein n=1 Tax=Phytophthora citrophthora TaxID=4793 RepID=A0AAD9GN20_9STRA|nr:hypothetical protein P3T76_007338 [Phytophthora citrophthora]